jgi:hypothetical protein
VEFQTKKALVSKAQVGRAARFLQALISATSELGWKTPSKMHNMSVRQGEFSPDLSLRLPSRELLVTICELDQSGRRVQAYTTERDYYTRTERTTANKGFQASGKLEVVIKKPWEDQTVLSLRDTVGAPLEDQLPSLIRELADRRSRSGLVSPGGIATFQDPRDPLGTGEAGSVHEALLRTQCRAASGPTGTIGRPPQTCERTTDEIDCRLRQFAGSEEEKAREWAAWIRQHADRTDPINGPLHLMRVTSASHNDLAPHMAGWSTYGPYRQ